MSNSNSPDYFAAIDAHIVSIAPAHRAAYQAPPPVSYASGQTVWVFDHYNTARVISPSLERTWVVELTDADGTAWRTVYLHLDLRPAAAPVQFRWRAPTARIRAALRFRQAVDRSYTVLALDGREERVLDARLPGPDETIVERGYELARSLGIEPIGYTFDINATI